MKKKLITWFNGVVDRAIASEAWRRKREAEDRVETLRDRCDIYEAAHERLVGDNQRLLLQLAQANTQLASCTALLADLQAPKP